MKINITPQSKIRLAYGGIAGLILCGVIAISSHKIQKKHNFNENEIKARMELRDSFNLTAKQFDELEIYKGKRSWKSLKDSVSRNYVRDSFNLSAKEFDLLNLREKGGIINWQQALDSLKKVR